MSGNGSSSLDGSAGINRRRFAVATGSVLSGGLLASNSVSRPAIAAEVETFAPDDVTAASNDGVIDSFTLEFDFEVTISEIQNTDDPVTFDFYADVSGEQERLATYEKNVESNDTITDEDLSVGPFDLTDYFDFTAPEGETETWEIILSIEIDHPDVQMVTVSDSFTTSLTHEVSEFLEGWEDSWSPWQNGGRTNTNFYRTSSRSWEGGYAARRDYSHYADYAVLEEQTGHLDSWPRPGTEFIIRIQSDQVHDSDNALFKFGVEDGDSLSGSSADSGYSVRYRPDQGFQLGGPNISATDESVTGAISADTWFKYRIRWYEDNSIEADLLDGNDNVISTVAGQDPEETYYDARGLSIRTFRGPHWFDGIEILGTV